MGAGPARRVTPGTNNGDGPSRTGDSAVGTTNPSSGAPLAIATIVAVPIWFAHELATWQFWGCGTIVRSIVLFGIPLVGLAIAALSAAWCLDAVRKKRVSLAAVFALGGSWLLVATFAFRRKISFDVSAFRLWSVSPHRLVEALRYVLVGVVLSLWALVVVRIHRRAQRTALVSPRRPAGGTSNLESCVAVSWTTLAASAIWGGDALVTADYRTSIVRWMLLSGLLLIGLTAAAFSAATCLDAAREQRVSPTGTAGLSFSWGWVAACVFGQRLIYDPGVFLQSRPAWHHVAWALVHALGPAVVGLWSAVVAQSERTRRSQLK